MAEGDVRSESEPAPESAESNPLLSGVPGAWDRIVDAIGPASVLAWIQAHMGETARSTGTAEDVWQETLLQAWRSRHDFEWRGERAFRRWLLEIARNRIRDAVDRESAARRGGGRRASPLVDADSSDLALELGAIGPVASTTPSRVAALREQAEAMRRALALLPDELRAVVELRLFEDLTLNEIAERLDITVAAVRHRFRRGAEQYSRYLGLDGGE